VKTKNGILLSFLLLSTSLITLAIETNRGKLIFYGDKTQGNNPCIYSLVALFSPHVAKQTKVRIYHIFKKKRCYAFFSYMHSLLSHLVRLFIHCNIHTSVIA